MRAIVVHEFGGPQVLRLEEVDDPKPKSQEVLVRIKAAGVNPVETYQRAGGQGYNRPLPFTPGADGAGVIEAVGADVSGYSVGDRVYTAGSVTGTYAELARCTTEQVFPLPPGVSYEDGACLWINYGTAYRALFQRGSGVAGESVLVHGATGGVGIAAVQWARMRGLEVLATFGSSEGEGLLRRQGVTTLFNHRDAEHARAILEATGDQGVDLIVEMLANVNLDMDMDLLARGGRIVVVGSRGSIEVTPRKLMAREADVRGLMLAGATPGEAREIHAAIGSAAASGAIKPVIQKRVALGEAAEAHRAVMEDDSHGKILLIP
ncbi:MAG: NADPH:quinone reductase [Spirochaetota bacterium]